MCSAGSNGPTSSSMPEAYKGPAGRCSGTAARGSRKGLDLPGLVPGAGQEAVDGRVGGGLGAGAGAGEGAVAGGGAGCVVGGGVGARGGAWGGGGAGRTRRVGPHRPGGGAPTRQRARSPGP